MRPDADADEARTHEDVRDVVVASLRYILARGVVTMRALEFQARISPDRTLTVPPEVAEQIEAEQPVRVILLLPDPNEEREWKRLAAEQFLKGYAESDAIYDEVPTG